MRSRACLRLFLAAAAVAWLAPPARAVETGVNETLHQRVPTAQTASALGADWVRLWASWEEAQPAPGGWDPAVVARINQGVAAAKARGLKVLIVVHRSPAWASGGAGGTAPPTDPATFGAAMGGFAAKVPGADAWELWNEEDETVFWSGGADPARYAAMVKAAYPAIKAVQPDDVVLTGATTGNNFDFVEQLYQHGVRGFFDAVAVHTDTACLVVGPDAHYRDRRGRIGRYVFTGYREVHRAMARYGDGDKRIWMTELGWNTQSTAPFSCSGGIYAGQKPLGVSEAQQAEFLTQAYRCMAADPIVAVAMWFGLQDVPGSAIAGAYGLYRGDDSPRPAAAAFAALEGGIAPQPCGATIDTAAPEIRIVKPLEGLRFVDVFDIEAEAVDGAGGAGIRRLELYADGTFVRSFGDGVAEISPWWDPRHWRRGTHALTFRASDEAGNGVSRTITVAKVRALPNVKTSAALALAQLDPDTVSVTGGVTAAGNSPTRPRGRAFVVFQRKVRGSWRRGHRIEAVAGTAVAITKTLRAATWRAFLDYPGGKGFKKSRSKPVRFRVL